VSGSLQEVSASLSARGGWVLQFLSASAVSGSKSPSDPEASELESPSGPEALGSGSEASESGSEVSESGSEASESGSEVSESGSEASELGSEASELGSPSDPEALGSGSEMGLLEVPAAPNRAEPAHHPTIAQRPGW
jgi:hypothetical protein